MALKNLLTYSLSSQVEGSLSCQEGVFTDSVGKEIVVKAGGVTITRKGQSHGLRNTGKEPLVILDTIGAQQ